MIGDAYTQLSFLVYPDFYARYDTYNGRRFIQFQIRNAFEYLFEQAIQVGRLDIDFCLRYHALRSNDATND